MSRGAPRPTGGGKKPKKKKDKSEDPAYTLGHHDLLKKRPGFTFDDPDDDEQQEQLTILVESEPEHGKSDFLIRHMPGPVYFCDTEIKNAPMVRKIRRELNRDDIYYKKIVTFDDFRQVCLYASEIGGGTVSLDSSADLLSLCVREWLEDSGLKKVYPLTNYQYIHNRIEVLVNRLKESGVVFAMSARRKDEWGKDAEGNDTVIGRQIETYKKFPWECSVHLELQFGIRDERNNLCFKNHRVAKVVKNSYWGMDTDRMLTFAKPYLFDVSVDGVRKELMEPWHPELDEEGNFVYGEYNGKKVILGGVKLDDEVIAKQIIEDAKEYFQETPDGKPLNETEST